MRSLLLLWRRVAPELHLSGNLALRTPLSLGDTLHRSPPEMAARVAVLTEHGHGVLIAVPDRAGRPWRFLMPAVSAQVGADLVT